MKARYVVASGFGGWNEFYHWYDNKKDALSEVNSLLKAGYGLVFVDRKTRHETVLVPPKTVQYSGPIQYPDMWGLE